MTLFDSLSRHGISVSSSMDTKYIIKMMSKLPTIMGMFPEVSNMVNQLQSYLDKFNAAKQTLQSAREHVESMENNLEKAKDAYNMILNTPTAYVGKGTENVLINPLPTLNIYYTSILSAQKLLEQAEKALDKAEEKVDSISNTIDSYKEKFVEKLINIKVI